MIRLTTLGQFAKTGELRYYDVGEELGSGVVAVQTRENGFIDWAKRTDRRVSSINYAACICTQQLEKMRGRMRSDEGPTQSAVCTIVYLYSVRRTRAMEHVVLCMLSLVRGRARDTF